MCHMSECHINSSRAKHSLLTGSVSGDVVYLLKACVCYLVSAGILTARPSLSLSLLSLALFRPRRLSLSQPRGPPAQRHGGERERERERERGLAEFQLLPRDPHTLTHTVLVLGFSLNWIATLSSVLASVPMTADILSHVHTLFTLFLSVPRGLTWQPDTWQWQRLLLLFN